MDRSPPTTAQIMGLYRLSDILRLIPSFCQPPSLTKAGNIIAYDDTTSQYYIEFQNFSIQTWTLMQVENHWRTKRHGDTWSESDNRRLRVQIRRIWGCSERARSHTTQTPFPSLLTRTTWTKTETWYTCDVKWSIPDRARAYTSTSQDKALAEELCDLQEVFWAPNSTWNWKSTSGSNRSGWMVQSVSHREEKGDVLLNVRSLHHSDHH
jgi:hypothetical protein